MDKRTIYLTCKQYLSIQALFTVTSDEYTRVPLSYVYYDMDKDLFVASDGYIMRQESIDWIDANKKPEHSFFIHRHDMLLTKKQLRDKYGRIFESKIIEFEYIVNRTYELNGKEEVLVYPKIWNVVPSESTMKPLEAIGINFSEFQRFLKSFYEPREYMIAQFTGQLTPILVFQKPDSKPRKFVGLIMPKSFPSYLT